MSFKSYDWQRAYVNDPGVGSDLIAFLAVLMAHMKNGKTFVGQKTIATCMGKTERTVRRCVKSAKELGYIKVIKVTGRPILYKATLPNAPDTGVLNHEIMDTDVLNDNEAPDTGVLSTGHWCPKSDEIVDTGVRITTKRLTTNLTTKTPPTPHEVIPPSKPLQAKRVDDLIEDVFHLAQRQMPKIDRPEINQNDRADAMQFQVDWFNMTRKRQKWDINDHDRLMWVLKHFTPEEIKQAMAHTLNGASNPGWGYFSKCLQGIAGEARPTFKNNSNVKTSYTGSFSEWLQTQDCENAFYDSSEANEN
jgi:hypothetical protein